MSANVREQAATLKAKYCRVFGLHEDEVTVREFVGKDGKDDAEIFANDKSLPRWTVGS